MADAPERFYLQWNAVNWITVVFMAFAGIALVGLVSSAVRHYYGKANVVSD